MDLNLTLDFPIKPMERVTTVGMDDHFHRLLVILMPPNHVFRRA